MKKETIESFRTLPEVVSEFVYTIPAKKLDIKRNAHTWTLREHLYHMVNVQEMLQNRIVTIRDENKPVIKAYFPEEDVIDSQDYRDIPEALQIYSAYRMDQMEMLKPLSPEDYEKQAEHGEYSEYSLPILIRHMIFHEYWHLHRMEEILYIKDKYFK